MFGMGAADVFLHGAISLLLEQQWPVSIIPWRSSLRAATDDVGGGLGREVDSRRYSASDKTSHRGS